MMNQIFYQQTGQNNPGKFHATKNTIWTKAPSVLSNAKLHKDHPHLFDMREQDRMSQPDRFSYADISHNGSISNEDSTPTRTGSNSGSMSVTDNTPITATPESIRQFDPDRFFGDMNLSGSGIDVAMNMGTTMDDAEFFTDMLGVNLTGN